MIRARIGPTGQILHVLMAGMDPPEWGGAGVPLPRWPDYAREYWREGALESRPSHALPSGPVAQGAALGGWPVGWPVRIACDACDQIAETDAAAIPADGQIVFGSPGLWRVEIAEDWSLGAHQAASTLIKVEAG